MNPRTTGLLALTAAILGGFIYFYEIEGESARQALRDDEKRIFPGLEADQVDALELSMNRAAEAAGGASRPHPAMIRPSDWRLDSMVRASQP